MPLVSRRLPRVSTASRRASRRRAVLRSIALGRRHLQGGPYGRRLCDYSERAALFCESPWPRVCGMPGSYCTRGCRSWKIERRRAPEQRVLVRAPVCTVRYLHTICLHDTGAVYGLSARSPHHFSLSRLSKSLHIYTSLPSTQRLPPRRARPLAPQPFASQITHQRMVHKRFHYVAQTSKPFSATIAARCSRRSDRCCRTKSKRSYAELNCKSCWRSRSGSKLAIM